MKRIISGRQEDQNDVINRRRSEKEKQSDAYKMAQMKKQQLTLKK
jgi:hypothetical protein